MAEKDTGELNQELKKTKQVKDFLKRNEDELQTMTLPEYLAALLKEKQRTKKEIIQASGLEETYAYHIFAGIKHPQRPKLLALALAFGLTADEAQYLLRLANLPQLYVRRPWDSVILHALDHRQSVMETNILLDGLGESQLLK